MDLLVIAIGVLIGAPILAYLCIKFGFSGYYRARDRYTKEQQKHDEIEIEK